MFMRKSPCQRKPGNLSGFIIGGLMITVIVPYYNAAPFLARCCQSLTEQEGEFEFLMVDDNSNDDGAEIVREFAATDERFVMLTNERRKGVSGARNTGLDKAQGEWITFLDADDKLTPDAWRLFRKATRRGGNMYQFEHYRYNSKRDRLRNKYPVKAGVYSIIEPPLLFVCVWNKLYKAEFIRDIRFDESVRYCEDELFNFECIAKENRICCIEGETVIHYTDNPQSLTKITTPEDLYIQACKLMLFIQRQNDPIIKCAVCRSLSEHWASNKNLDVIGERQKIGGDNGKE